MPYNHLSGAPVLGTPHYASHFSSRLPARVFTTSPFILDRTLTRNSACTLSPSLSFKRSQWLRGWNGIAPSHSRCSMFQGTLKPVRSTQKTSRSGSGPIVPLYTGEPPPPRQQYSPRHVRTPFGRSKSGTSCLSMSTSKSWTKSSRTTKHFWTVWKSILPL